MGLDIPCIPRMERLERGTRTGPEGHKTVSCSHRQTEITVRLVREEREAYILIRLPEIRLQQHAAAFYI